MVSLFPCCAAFNISSNFYYASQCPEFVAEFTAAIVATAIFCKRYPGRFGQSRGERRSLFCRAAPHSISVRILLLHVPCNVLNLFLLGCQISTPRYPNWFLLMVSRVDLNFWPPILRRLRPGHHNQVPMPGCMSDRRRLEYSGVTRCNQTHATVADANFGVGVTTRV